MGLLKMPKFSKQRILKSKLVLASFLHQEHKDYFLFKQEVHDKAMYKTKLLLSEDDPNFDNFFDSNYNLLVNSSIKMSIPKIRNRFESGYALFYPNDSVKVDKDLKYPSFYIFNENEFINYAINRQQTLLQVGRFRNGVIRFYSKITDDFITESTGLSRQDITDEIEYAKSMSNVRYKRDTTFLLSALINCNKIVDFMRYILDIDAKRSDLFLSLKNPAYHIGIDIAKVRFQGQIYYIVPIAEDMEINTMKDDYDLTLLKR